MKNEWGLTGPQEKFAQGVAAGKSQAEAYREAYPRSKSWAPQSVIVNASKLSADTNVAPRIAMLRADALAKAKIDVEWVVSRMRDIADADAGELMELRRVCCRYCWGKGFRYQRTAGEMETDRTAFLLLPDKDRARLGGQFDEKGGTGYHAKKDPNPECPECFGDGVEAPVFKDTRKVSTAARRLFAGLKVTDKGMEIKLRDQDAALDRLGKYAGVYEKDNEQARHQTRVVIVPAKSKGDEEEQGDKG